MKFFAALIFALVLVCAVQARSPTKPEPADDCPSICPLNFLPVCASDGDCVREFSNTCELKVARCSGKKNFREVPQVECNKRITRRCE